jgi:hypothetical protein
LFIDLVEGGGFALRGGQLLLRPALRLVHVALRLLLRGKHFLECIDHFGRRIDLGDFHALDLHARAIGIEHALHLVAHVLLDRGAAGAHGIVEAHFGNRRAHCGFGHFAHGLVRIGELVGVELEILDVPAHQVIEIDQVLVAGEHQPLAIAFGDGLALDRGDVARFDRLDRPGQGERNPGPSVRE